jgi:hypothetical protein
MDSLLDGPQTPPTGTTVLDKLKEALVRLPVLLEQRQHIPDCAQSLAIAAALFAVRDAPRARVGGSKKARAELEILVELTIDLNNHVQSLHGDTLAYIREQAEQLIGHPPRRLADEPLQVADDLLRLAIAADRAHKKLARADEQLPGPGGWTHRAKAVTEKAARIFERLTGEKATVRSRAVDTPASSGKRHEDYGPFRDFLQEIFDVLNIDASAAAQSREFMKKRRRKTTSELLSTASALRRRAACSKGVDNAQHPRRTTRKAGRRSDLGR